VYLSASYSKEEKFKFHISQHENEITSRLNGSRRIDVGELQQKAHSI
jgi:hypothetical protein